MSIERSKKLKSLSRREFMLLAAGGTGTVAACVCAGAAGSLYWVLSRRGASVAEVQLMATSSANRFNRVKKIDKPQVVSRIQWGAEPPNHGAEYEDGYFSEENPEGWLVYADDIRDIYKTLVIHHSVEDEGDDISTLHKIQELHQVDRGWADVAYHFFIGVEGTIYEGRAVDVRGTHVGGYNTGSLGVCFLGNYMERELNPAQLEAARRLGQWLTVRLQLTHLAGHRQFNDNTVCPGDNIMKVIKQMSSDIGLAFGTEGYEGPLPEEEQPTTRCGCHL